MLYDNLHQMKEVHQYSVVILDSQERMLQVILTADMSTTEDTKVYLSAIHDPNHQHILYQEVLPTDFEHHDQKFKKGFPLITGENGEHKKMLLTSQCKKASS